MADTASHASPSTPARGHVFNDDLLVNEKDLAFAKSQFPKIIHLLDYPRLRQKFSEYDREANQARGWVRRLGLGAVASAGLALIALATEPAWPDNIPVRFLALVFELGGVVAALVAGGGLFLGPWKRRWLEARLMTERLRQWHFQLLVRRGKDVEASFAGPDAIAHFQGERDRWLDSFLQSYEGKLESHLESLTEEPGTTGTWLHDCHTEYSQETVLTELFAAFEQLRFNHQHTYALYKLRKSSAKHLGQFLDWPVVQQMAVLAGASQFCFGCALICSAVLIYGYAIDVLATGSSAAISSNAEQYIRLTAIVIALLGAALRTIQDGLAPDKEIERYKDYRGRTFQLLDSFKHTTDIKEHLRLMEELEIASVDEMKGFLRTHYNARFVLA